jgi:hypothetical protein
VMAGFGALMACCLLGAGCAEEVPPPAGVDCGAHSSCGVDGPPCAAGEECISIAGCSSAVCIDAGQACLETCGAPSCLILESFPAQLRCENGEPVPGREGDPVDPAPVSCDALEADRRAELASIQSCSSDAECGQEMVGTSCGCTRNLVARAGADTARFREIQASLAEAECDSLVTTCDCPPADGFVCSAGRCAWNYTSVAP